MQVWYEAGPHPQIHSMNPAPTFSLRTLSNWSQGKLSFVFRVTRSENKTAGRKKNNGEAKKTASLLKRRPNRRCD